MIARTLPAEIRERERFRLLNTLAERLEEEVLDTAFAEGPVEACIARIRQGLGLPADEAADEAAATAPTPNLSGPFPLDGGVQTGDKGGARSGKRTAATGPP